MSQIFNDDAVEVIDSVPTYDNPFKFIKPLISSKKVLDPSTDHWYSGQVIPLRDPLVVKYGEYNETIELMNYSLYKLEVDVYFEYPTFAEGKHKIFTLTIEPLENIIIKTGVMDKYNETKLFVEVEDERYKKLLNMNICWNVTIPMYCEYGGTKRQTKEDVKNILMAITNLAYTIQSEEMVKTLYNFEKIVGRKFRIFPEYKDDTGAGVSNYKNYPTNTPEEIMCIDLTKDEDLNHLLKVWGVGSSHYGGPQTRNTFSLGACPNSDKIGAAVTQGGWWPANFYRGLGHGSIVKVREQYFKNNKGNVIHKVLIHEIGHVLGFWHYNSMCYGEMIDEQPRLIESIANLLREDLPYWEELPNENKVRCGGNDYERYIINNPDFLPKFYEKLSAEREARNKEYSRVMKANVTTGNPFADMFANQNIVNSLHPVDNLSYTLCSSLNIFKPL